MTESVFDRIDITFAGQALTARPIGFVMDEHQNPISADKWETTCPGCGCAVQFGVADVAILDDKTYVCCPECKAGENERSRIKSDELSVARVGQHIGKLQMKTVVPVDRGCPFMDPIDSGVFRTDFPAPVENPFKTDVPIVLETTPVDKDEAQEVERIIQSAQEKEKVKDAGDAQEVAQIQERAKKNVQAREATDVKEAAAVVESAKKKAPNMVLGMGAAPPDEE